jgi:murein DD-endopeptidase MepM/ murein hydrolase activator NlpD
LSSNFRIFIITLFILLISCFSAGKQHDFLSCNEICKLGSKYVDWFYSSNLDSMKNKILDTNYRLSELTHFRSKVESQLGNKLALLNVQFGIEPWQCYYIHYNRFEKTNQPVRTLFTFDNKGKILQFSVQVLPQEAKTHFSNYEPSTKLTLPFKGKWFVAWGGRNINENQHAVSRSQRFAYDLVIRNGCKTFDGTGKFNSDYYCYEQEVISPAPGKIVEVINNIEENNIGQQPEIHGNRIVIDHGHNEYSVLGHLKKGSIVVKVNDFVERGQRLGLCGNNGNSSEPHIHYHLQNSSDIDNGDGLPIKFYSYLSNGEYINVGGPKIGEWIQNHVAK